MTNIESGKMAYCNHPEGKCEFPKINNKGFCIANCGYKFKEAKIGPIQKEVKTSGSSRCCPNTDQGNKATISNETDCTRLIEGQSI